MVANESGDDVRRPPAANGTMTVMGFSGYWASAGAPVHKQDNDNAAMHEVH